MTSARRGTGKQASQAMLIAGNNNMSRLQSCLDAADHCLFECRGAENPKIMLKI